MNEQAIVTVYVVIEDMLKARGHASDPRAQVSDAEVLTVAVWAAKYVHNHPARTLCLLTTSGYLRQRLSVSRFNRRIHALSSWLLLILESLCALSTEGEIYIIDSMPVPVCRGCRAGRCRKVKGLAYCGYCAAKKEKLYGYRLHLVGTPPGLPVAFQILPLYFTTLPRWRS